MKTLKQRLDDGDIVFGATVCEHLRPSVVKAYVNAGFDFIFLENEHASFDPSRLADFVLCARDHGLTVVSKLGELSRADTARLLEMGAAAVSSKDVTKSGGWECACCQTENTEADSNCTVCVAERPKQSASTTAAGEANKPARPATGRRRIQG